MRRKLLYDDEVYEACLRRIGGLSPESQPVWGSMSVGQMLAHCAEIQEVANGKPLENTPFIVRLLGPVIKKMVVGDKPYPRSTRTHPQYVQVAAKEFGAERDRLVASLEAFRQGENGPPTRHAIFGELTREEKGWSCYKHLDHHLTQFGL